MLLIDGQPIAYRAFHAFDLYTSRGEPTNIIHGGLKILRGILEKLPREEPVIFWDSGKSRYRTAKYPSYKAGREGSRSKPGYADTSFHDQVTALEEILAAFGVRQIKVRGVEADDLINLVTMTIPGSHIAVADDMDLWQLIQWGARVYAPRRDCWINRETCRKEMGCYPEQILDYKVLAGDHSDNIPGIPGIGEKTALAILAVCGDVQELYRRLHAGERAPVGDRLRDTLLTEESNARLWYDIVQPLTPEMLSDEERADLVSRWRAPRKVDRVEAIALLDRWELRSFSEGFEDLLSAFGGWDGSQYPETAEASPVSKEVGPVGISEPSDWLGRLNQLAGRLQDCQACPMRRECRAPVPGNVDDSSQVPRVMIVGRNPGANEDRLGKGFVGASGQRLDRWLAGQDGGGRQTYDAIFSRARVWISNTAKCLTAGNRPPSEEEWSICAALYLREEIRIIQPQLILTFGAEAMTAVTGLELIMKRSGTVVQGADADGVIQYRFEDGQRVWDPVIPADTAVILMPHPSAAMRSAAAELKFQQAGRIVKAWVDQYFSV